MPRFTLEIDEQKHLLWIHRHWKISEAHHSTIAACIKLTAQAETLLKRSLKCNIPSDADCWLIATGTEFNDPQLQSKEFARL